MTSRGQPPQKDDLMTGERHATAGARRIAVLTGLTFLAFSVMFIYFMLGNINGWDARTTDYKRGMLTVFNALLTLLYWALAIYQFHRATR